VGQRWWWKAIYAHAKSLDASGSGAHEDAVDGLRDGLTDGSPPKWAGTKLELMRAALVLESQRSSRHWRNWSDWALERAVVSDRLSRGGVEGALGCS
jgi:hypothetical protein